MDPDLPHPILTRIILSSLDRRPSSGWGGAAKRFVGALPLCSSNGADYEEDSNARYWLTLGLRRPIDAATSAMMSTRSSPHGSILMLTWTPGLERSLFPTARLPRRPAPGLPTDHKSRMGQRSRACIRQQHPAVPKHARAKTCRGPGTYISCMHPQWAKANADPWQVGAAPSTLDILKPPWDDRPWRASHRRTTKASSIH